MSWMIVCPLVGLVLAVLCWLILGDMMSGTGMRYETQWDSLKAGWPALGLLWVFWTLIGAGAHWAWRGLAALFGG